MSAKTTKENLLSQVEVVIQGLRDKFAQNENANIFEYYIENRKSYSIPVIDDDVPFIIFKVEQTSFSHRPIIYKIPNKIQPFFDFYKKLKALKTNTPDNKPNKRGKIKPAGKDLNQIQKEACSDWENAYHSYFRAGNIRLCRALKKSLKYEFRELYNKIKEHEQLILHNRIRDYKRYNDVEKELIELEKWKLIVNNIKQRKITLKSLQGVEFYKTPSYCDVKEKLHNAEKYLDDKLSWAEREKGDIQQYFPEVYEKMFNKKEVEIIEHKQDQNYCYV